MALHERMNTRAESVEADPMPAGKARRRHCWVEYQTGRCEGLVLQWAQDERGWVALVMYVIPQAGGDIAVQEWLPAARLQPAD